MTTDRVEAGQVINLILDGVMDEHFEHIQIAMKMRRKVLAVSAAANLRTGDRFHIQNISPKYLDGVIVEYLENKGGATPIRVKLVYGIRNYPAGFIFNLRESHVGEQVL